MFQVLFIFFAGFCARSEAIRDLVKPDWLLVLNGLLHINQTHATSRSQTAIRKWREFGLGAGIDEQRLRQSVSSRTRNKSGCKQGCNWLRCPLHEGIILVPPREVMRCTGCKEVSAVRTSLYRPNAKFPSLGRLLQPPLPETVSTRHTLSASPFVDRSK